MSGAKSGRIAALDLGTHRIGVAVSNEERTLAFPRETISTRSIRILADELRVLFEREGVVEVVVGVPKALDGGEGPMARRVLKMADHLREMLAPIPFHTWDERYTTREAERALHEAGRPGRKRKAVRDAVAACLILEGYLQWKRGRE